jgi:hypothetical protein
LLSKLIFIAIACADAIFTNLLTRSMISGAHLRLNVS